jgi:hypothetical protein
MVDYQYLQTLLHVGDTVYLQSYLQSRGVKSAHQYRQLLAKAQPGEQLCKEGLVQMAEFLQAKDNTFRLEPVTCM